MIISAAPDGRSTDNSAAYILHEREQLFYGSGAGWLSIKTFRGGRANYRVGSAHFAVDDSSYLILNHGSDYIVSIESTTPVESFCLFLPPGFVAAVRRDLTTPDGRLLNDPHGPALPLEFFERTYAHDRTITPVLGRIYTHIGRRTIDAGLLEEQFHELAIRMLQVHHCIAGEAQRMPAARPATREELYRRLHLARDYIEAQLATTVSLADLAAVAGLSPNHLLRTFRRLFGLTPHQYLTERRLQLARSLLTQTRRTISDICLDVGFESLGSFSWLFRRRYGVSPSAYRRENR